MATKERKTLSGRVGAASRWNRPESDALRTELAEYKITEYVRQVVDAAPPLGPEQRRRLAALFAGPDAAPDTASAAPPVVADEAPAAGEVSTRAGAVA